MATGSRIQISGAGKGLTYQGKSERICEWSLEDDRPPLLAVPPTLPHVWRHVTLGPDARFAVR